VDKRRPALFRRSHFEDYVIVLCVRWYLRYCLTLRDLEEMMRARDLAADHSTIGRWVLRYAQELHKRICRELRPPSRSSRVDETYIRVAGAALWRAGQIRPRVLNVPTRRRSPRSKQTGELPRRCRCRPCLYLNNVLEQDRRL
jgi:transposase-like protein